MAIYNCAQYLPEAIDSILAQTYTNWELILCDDASTDNTYQVAKEYADKYPEKIILEQIKELKEIPYHILIDVDDCQHDIFKEVEVIINIKKYNAKNVILQVNVIESENWAIIGKSKVIEEYSEEKCEREIKIILLPLIDGFLKLPEIEFSELELKNEEDIDKYNKSQIISEVEFEPIEYGTVIEGN